MVIMTILFQFCSVFMAFWALQHKISRLSSLVLAVLKEITLSYHLARKSIINEGKSGTKSLWYFCIGVSLLLWQPSPVKTLFQAETQFWSHHSTSVSLLSWLALVCNNEQMEVKTKKIFFLKRSKCLLYPQVCFLIQKQTFSCFRKMPSKLDP